MIRKILTIAGALVALGFAYACNSDRSLAPVTHSLGTAELVRTDRSVPDLATVIALRRSVYLTDDVTESAVIGPDGGEIAIEESGSKIVFPAGALPRNTRIKMTAKAGWNVAYEFSPHGITFAVPVTVQQDLGFTVINGAAAAAKVQAGYFQGSLDSVFLDDSRSIARVSELRNTALGHPLNSLVAKFYIYHFSGYILSSGFAGDGGDSASDGNVPQP
ncbi:MAG TPA: hypothetical protein VGH98_02775 [Gemmatimonadaceae bacterium]|jgi:hypothetical protein